MFSVITPTGDRPVAFANCVRLMAKQTRKPKEWIIMDDGKSEMSSSDLPKLDFVKYYRRSRRPNEPAHTLPVQMQAAISRVTTEKVIIIEDDDWYDELYLEQTNMLLDIFDIVGLTDNIYYYLNSRQYFIHANKEHSSFCSTGFTKRHFGFFHHIKLNNPYIDLQLWRTRPSNKLLYKSSPPTVIGMKGLPGRIGATYTANQTILRKGLIEDPELNYLKSIMNAEDFAFYKTHSGGDSCTPS